MLNIPGYSKYFFQQKEEDLGFGSTWISTPISEQWGMYNNHTSYQTNKHSRGTMQNAHYKFKTFAISISVLLVVQNLNSSTITPLAHDILICFLTLLFTQKTITFFNGESKHISVQKGSCAHIHCSGKTISLSQISTGLDLCSFNTV